VNSRDVSAAGSILSIAAVVFVTAYPSIRFARCAASCHVVMSTAVQFQVNLQQTSKPIEEEARLIRLPRRFMLAIMTHANFEKGELQMKFANIAKIAAVWAFASGWNCVNGADKTVALRWQVESIRPHNSQRANDGPVISGLSIHPSGSHFAICGDDHLVRIIDAKTRQTLHTLNGHTDWVRSAQFSHDGKTLVTAGNDGRIIAWDLSSTPTRKVIATESRAIFDVAFDAESKQLMSVGFDDTLNIYDLESRQRVQTLICPCDDMLSVAISPDNHTIAAGGRSGVIRLWHRESGQSIRDVKPHQQRVRDVVFMPDNESIVSAGDDRRLVITRFNKVIEPSTELPKVDSMIYSLAVLDDHRVASGGTDNVIRIWDLTTQEQTGFLEGHTGTVNRLSLFESKLYSAGFDTEVRIWETGAEVVAKDSDSNPGVFIPTSNAVEK
jgi:WD40 repeat protein